MQQVPNPFIVTPIRETAPETTVGDVIFGALGLAGVMAVAAVVLGLVVATVLILWHRRRRPEADHLPPVSPLAGRSSLPPTTPDR